MAPGISREEAAARVHSTCPELEREAVFGFLERLDDDYIARHPPDEIALHVRMAGALSSSRPAAVDVRSQDDGRFDLTVVAYDYFAEFSLLCGLLAVHGLSIEYGDVHTFEPAASARHPDLPSPFGAQRRRLQRAPAVPSRKIVDVFRVRPRDVDRPPQAERLERELRDLLALVAAGGTDEARAALNRRLVESLERSAAPFTGDLRPVEIEVLNPEASRFSVLRVRGQDTPAFLYALTNALAMRGIYVHKVRIESHGSEVHDEFFVGRESGGRIESPDEQQALRLAAVLIKQFTHFLPYAPDPARALTHFDRFLDQVMTTPANHEVLRLLDSPEGLRPLARFLGSSDFLWEDLLRTRFTTLVSVLNEWSTRPLAGRDELGRELRARLQAAGSPEAERQALNQWKDEAVFFVETKRLLDPSVTLEAFSRATTEVAEAVIEESQRLVHDRLAAIHGRPRMLEGGICPVTLFGLGKFGGAEMGYASDLEMLCIYGGPGTTERSGVDNGVFFDDLVRGLNELIEARPEGIFRLDFRLRPHGNKGPLATPFPLLGEYYRPGGGAHPFERQALIKLRPMAGDAALGRQVVAFRDAYVWGDEPFDLGAVLQLHERQVRELVPPGRFNVKYSPGGLVEVEYSVQYLQLQHGRAHAELRTPATLTALDRLHDAELLDLDEHACLRSAYLFWRSVADGLRMVRGNAKDLILPDEDSDEYRLLARRLRYEGPDWNAVARDLSDDVKRHREAVHSFFVRKFRTDPRG